ncbi:MAG: hypothetical protein LBQ51_05865 [Desulfovibrio sp.]|jgi:hypothetical protein|nr:hypothetical protein [Desulfovibrio sp.]
MFQCTTGSVRYLFRIFTFCLLTFTLSVPAGAAADKAGSAVPATAGKSAAPADAVPPKADDKAAPKAESKAAPKAEKKAASKTAPKPAAAPAKRSAAGSKVATAPAGQNLDEIMHRKLEEFAREAIETMNTHALPSQNKKEIKKNADGSYTARYVAIDPSSIRVSFKKAESTGAVSHIGYMHYTEREYFCTASTEAAAKNGPFEPKINKSQTELVKYMRGKWSY